MGGRRRPEGTALGARASVGRVGEECCQRALARYHYPAEWSSRRPSPRGAGSRAVRWFWGGWVWRALRLSRPGGGFLARAGTCTTTRLSGAHGGRAHWGQAAGRYVGSGEVRCAAPPQQARRRVPRSGQDLYHYPAERSSRRPRPRGAGGRTVHMQSQLGS
jgi:hypothetical protein